MSLGGDSFYTEEVMQSVEDALVAELKSVFGDMKIYSSAKKGQIPPECVIFTIKPMMFSRESDYVQRRTIMFDIAVVTQKSKYWVADRLMKVTSIQLGDVKKILDSGRFSEVVGIMHFTSYMYLTEVND